MTSQTSFGSNMLFQSINDDLNASLATADELSKEFSSLMEAASPSLPPPSLSQNITIIPREKPLPMNPPKSSTSTITATWERSPGISDITTSMPYSPSATTSIPFSPNATTSMPYSTSSTTSMPFSPSSPSPRSFDSVIASSMNRPSSPGFTPHQLTPPQARRGRLSPLPHTPPEGFMHSSVSPHQSPQLQRRESPDSYRRSPRNSVSKTDGSLSLDRRATVFERLSQPAPHYPSQNLLSPYDAAQRGRRSPRPDRSPSPRPFSHPVSSTLPRDFTAFKQIDESGGQRQRSPAKWNETDLDVSYEKKPHNTYDKTEWLRQSVPNSSWRESNLDGPPPTHTKKDSIPRSHQPSHGSLPRNARISVPPDISSPTLSPYHPQPIISRISIPPSPTQPRQHRPIPLSVIMRLQNPYWAAAQTRHVMDRQGEEDMRLYSDPMTFPKEFFSQPMHSLQPHPPQLRPPFLYGEVLHPGDIEAELEHLSQHIPVNPEQQNVSEKHSETEQTPTSTPRPLSPTRLQPVVAPQVQNQEIPDLEEVLRLRAEIPRALKRRGSVEQSAPLKKASQYEPNQYKHLINKLFSRTALKRKGEPSSELGSSSDDEEGSMPCSPVSVPLPPNPVPQDYRSYHSILRRANRERKGPSRRARLSPLVLLLDGSLVGELETVKRAAQEINDPSQPNDEGITALHNAICGGHYAVVDFLVRIGANVSAPDSHGWTPLHCAASCNDRPLCEFLVGNGAAVMAVTESDGATARQKCDPYAIGFEECESFLRGVEEAMGVDNSGVLYALWSFTAQAADELSFKEGDMVTILQKPDGVDWWWASLCGREGFVPNNYFGLFPKVRPKSLC